MIESRPPQLNHFKGKAKKKTPLAGGHKSSRACLAGSFLKLVEMQCEDHFSLGIQNLHVTVEFALINNFHCAAVQSP